MKQGEKLKFWGANISLAFFYFFFAYRNFGSLQVELKLSVVLLLLFNTSVVILALVRRSPQAVTRSSFDYTIAICGTLAPLLFSGLPESNDYGSFLFLQLIGIVISYAGLLSLNRSFGLVPADRGIVTSGMYSFVRHPLYSGYVLLCLGFLLQNFSLHNLAAFMTFIIFESLRLLMEEQFLMRNQDYVRYMKKVRWRVLPLVW